MPKRQDRYRLVYSSDSGRLPDATRKATTAQPAPAGDGAVRLRRETKGRGGKTVTTIHGLPLAGADMRELAGELKRACGTGGAVKNGVVEIQGDHRDRLVTELEQRGYRPKLAGG